MAPATGQKRKSDASSSAAAKKARAQKDEETAQLVERILSDTENFHMPEDTDAARDYITQLARYARGLEDTIAASKPKEKSPQEVAAAAEKLRNAAASGIKKQMTWKTTCKTGSAKWMYDGVCSDPAVFGAMLGLDGPPKFKTKKMTVTEFQDAMGYITASVRYDDLSISGATVNVHWKPDEGTFKLSGTYGK
ncbi:hypothetical protein HGRIS_010174 [Hohenbuehelia grisea]|uniref:Uncharacterized protein n=1 Tax=Hohenbuehelia grisea TaxID=104357 RepID=A0ABR3J3T9_9AGAR